MVAGLPGENGSLRWLHLAWQKDANQWRLNFATITICCPKIAEINRLSFQSSSLIQKDSARSSLQS
jgi:hypothetical protein